MPRRTIGKIEQEFLTLAAGDWTMALELLKGQIAWMEHIYVHEMTEVEQETVIKAAARSYKAFRWLTAKYSISRD